MATQARYFRDTPVKENQAAPISPRRETRALADPFALRTLPNDDIYFYAKRVDNSRLVRQADPASRGECWSAVGAAAVLLMLGGSIIAPHVGSVLSGYKVEALKQERQSLLNQRRELEVKEAALLSPGRLNALARAHRLTNPDPDQVVHLDPAASEGDVARNQAPSDRGNDPGNATSAAAGITQ